MLYRKDLSRVPSFHKAVRINATITCPVAIHISSTLLRYHAREMWRLEGRDEPLVDSVVGDAVESEFPTTP
jgi:hypothetical protein